MSEEKPKKGKMKIAGYICLAFAAVISILVLIPPVGMKSAEALPIIYYWGGLGIALLFGNAGKRIGGAAVMNRAPQPPASGN